MDSFAQNAKVKQLKMRCFVCVSQGNRARKMNTCKRKKRWITGCYTFW